MDADPNPILVAPKPVLVVVVLYRTSIAASETCASLLECMRARPQLGALLNILLIDNSPEAQALPLAFAAEYLHDGHNPGLASRYNEAMGRAVTSGAGWLLLLDDDTTLSASFFDHLLQNLDEVQGRQEVVAIIPRLVGGEHLLSPHLPAFREPTCSLHAHSHGLLTGLIRVFNSGSTLRVGALEAIGGFDERFWLDSLDHDTFHRLQQGGGRILLMDVSLPHALSVSDPGHLHDPARAARRNNQLVAETDFYRLHGTPEERRRRRNHLLREAWTALRAGLLAESGRLLRTAWIVRRP